ncbi:MAG: Uma2 family endonuclease [Anaerolineae bacterium]|nr:Uma2 family endonuclease [Anaerolineae bacterium]MDW8171292.1 hypothetical protein [Anaerolineae bacterium]
MSEATLRWDRGPKFALQERYGLRELWLVNPAPPAIKVWVCGAPEGASYAELLLHSVFVLGQTPESLILGHRFPVRPFFGVWPSWRSGHRRRAGPRRS